MGRHWPLVNDRLQTLFVSGSRGLRAKLLTFSKDSSAFNVPTGAKHLQPGKIPQLESLGFLKTSYSRSKKKQSRSEDSHSDLQAGMVKKLFQSFFTRQSFLWPMEPLGPNLCTMQAHALLF